MARLDASLGDVAALVPGVVSAADDCLRKAERALVAKRINRLMLENQLQLQVRLRLFSAPFFVTLHALSASTMCNLVSPAAHVRPPSWLGSARLECSKSCRSRP